MNILDEYVLFCEVAIHHGDRTRRRRPSVLPPSLSFTAGLSGALGAFNVQLDEFNYHLLRGGGGGEGGWMDRWRDG